MKTILASLLGLSSLVLSVGCTVEGRVEPRRPEGRVEVIPERPSPRHTWVAGRWDERGGGRTWVEGRWELH